MRDNRAMAEAVPIEEAAQRFADVVESVTKHREREQVDVLTRSCVQPVPHGSR